MLRRTALAAIQPLVANRVYTVRHGLAKGLRRRGGLGFLPQLGKSPIEEPFLERLDLAGRTVYDVGGYQGVFTLFFARQVGPTGRVVTFEPNPRHVAIIRENIALNRFTHASVRQVAVGAGPGHGVLVFPSDESARGSLEGHIQDQIRHEKQVETVEVDVDSLDRQIVTGLPHPDFVKIDVEGLEFPVLQGMTRTLADRHPSLYIELHGADKTAKYENASAVIHALWEHGYHIHHVESGIDVTRTAQIDAAIEGHVYCT